MHWTKVDSIVFGYFKLKNKQKYKIILTSAFYTLQNYQNCLPFLLGVVLKQ